MTEDEFRGRKVSAPGPIKIDAQAPMDPIRAAFYAGWALCSDLAYAGLLPTAAHRTAAFADYRELIAPTAMCSCDSTNCAQHRPE